MSRADPSVDAALESWVEGAAAPDGDSVVLRGRARGDGHRIGFGACEGTSLAARSPRRYEAGPGGLD